MGPRYLVRTAGLEMHPIDTADRREYLKDEGGVGFCNITKCCTEVCPEHIKITDNAIIPLKERVADRYYDPIQIVWRKVRGEPCREGRAGTGPERLARGAAAARRSRRPTSQRPGRPGRGGRPADGRRRGDELSRVDREPDPTLWPPPMPTPLEDGERAAADLIGPDRPASTDRADRSPSAGSGLRLIVRTDGAARGNPGPASAGAVLIDADRPGARDPLAPPLASISDYLGVQTNNVAEYTAVVRALGLAGELGASEVDLLLDSKLIVEQVHGRWRVKDAKLQPLHAEARRRLASFRPLDGRPCPAGPELGRRRVVQRGDRPGPGGRPGVGRPPAADAPGSRADRGPIDVRSTASRAARSAAGCAGRSRPRRSSGRGSAAGRSSSSCSASSRWSPAPRPSVGLPFAVGMALALVAVPSLGCGSSWRRRRRVTGRSPARS